MHILWKVFKTVKTYSYNNAGDDVLSNAEKGQFYRMTVHERDEDGRVLFDLAIKGTDTSYGRHYQYDIKDGLVHKEYTYPKWPDTSQHTLSIKIYNDLKQVKSENIIETDQNGNQRSYRQITYIYDQFNRLAQERDSSSSRCTAKIL